MAALEECTTYPLGKLLIRQFHFQPGDSETFAINHGKDYFAFFKRMGEVEYAIAKDKKTDQVVGVGAGVLRKVPLSFQDQDELTQACTAFFANSF